MPSELSGKELITIAFEKIFTSDIVSVLINVILPCIISIHCTKYEDNKKWWLTVFGMCAIIILYNITSVIVKKN